jgi:cytochrome c oxidase subunit II
MTRRPRVGRDPRAPRLRPLAAYAALAVLVAACDEEVRDAVTDPATPQAADLNWLWSLSFWMGTAVWIVVMVLLAVPILRSRRARDDEPAELAAVAAPGREPPGAEIDEPMVAADPDRRAEARRDAKVRSRLLWIGGIIVPVIILFVLLIADGRVGASTAHVDREGELVVDVVGHMFWWEVSYPEEEIVTANEINIPVDRPVRFRLSTEDVIHSFWLPPLHGKTDMIPGQENWQSFVPTQTGRFRGNCAEFCGIAHAQMVVWVEVMEPDDYDDWVLANQTAPDAPETETAIAGQRAYFEAGCAACHAIDGTASVARVGPDLTNLASRGTLAAGIVPNTRDNLRELIVDPWGLKPGNPMPPTIIDDDELDALLDYLETLQ